MNDIYVKIKPPTELGRIHYLHDPEIYESILFISSSTSRYNIWHVNIQGGSVRIIFDTNRLLKDVECVYPRSAWVVSQTLFIPDPDIHGDIELIDVKSDNGVTINPYSSERKGIIFWGYQDDDTKVRILTDNSFSIAWIMIGDYDRSGKWVGLSDRCSALIRDGKLAGFAVDLENAPLRSFPNRGRPM